MNNALTSLRSRDELDRALLALEDQPGYGLINEDEVTQLERAAVAAQDQELIWRARLLAAEISGRRGELAEAMRRMQEVNELAAAHGHTRLLARSHLNIAWTYRNVGDLASGLEHAVKAVELLDDDAPAAMRAMHLMRLADALDECGSWDEALLHYEQAEQVALGAGQVARQVMCLNNRAYAEYVNGDLEAAESTVNRLLQVCRLHDAPLRANTLDTIARIQIALGRYEDAISTIDRAVEVYHAMGVQEALTPAEFLLTRVLIQRKLGDLDGAQRSLDESRSLGSASGLASVLVNVEEEQAELHAARGDFEKAFRCFKAFHAAEKALISEQRAAQSKLRQALLETNEVRAEAARLQRLDAFRTQMIATISHELKNPLTAVTGHLELMSSLPNIPADGLRSMSAIQRGADRLWALTDSLLELTRLEQSEDPPRRELVDLDAVLTGALDQVEVVADGEGVRIDRRASLHPLLVLGDADELHRALVNLLSNAVKYGDGGDAVVVSLERVGHEIEFRCADTGLGISEDDQQRLFTEFFRSTNEAALGRPGTGLGLAIVQHIVVRHGGRIDVDSELGVGSTFTVRLPVASPAD
ncbi:ATP-binding protein [Nocardioides sp.]|uniref:ATP-binding protein n=1 Tax=Nocardioides sp. TaxID=35761 RepID=UPI002B53038C|nr:ATP-binding protein [Nocardioides sp.]HXH78838.1 ATP-binding protein [Nocardioides sp.]